MNRAYLKHRLLFVIAILLVALVFVWVMQNPMWYFEKVLTVCGTVMGLYVVAAIAMQLYAASQQPQRKVKRKNQETAPATERILSDDGEIMEVIDDNQDKILGDENEATR